jgi:hypothetical protein
MSPGRGPRGGRPPSEGADVALYEAGWPVTVAPISRGSVSPVFALVKGERCSPAHEGIRRWGRHRPDGPATAARQHVALTHPSNLREIRVRIARASSTGSRVHEGGGPGARMPNAPGLEHAAIAQQRIEDAGETTGEGDDDVFTAARGDAQGPGPQRLGLRRVPAKEGDCGLNQPPAHGRVAGLGDRTPALGLARAVLAGHEVELGIELLVEGTDDGEQRRDHRAEAARQGGRPGGLHNGGRPGLQLVPGSRQRRTTIPNPGGIFDGGDHRGQHFSQRAGSFNFSLRSPPFLWSPASGWLLMVAVLWAGWS